MLWRLTGQDNLVIGVAADGRKYEELELALGLLSKYLPLLCQVNEEASFYHILEKNNKPHLDNPQSKDSPEWCDPPISSSTKWRTK